MQVAAGCERDDFECVPVQTHVITHVLQFIYIYIYTYIHTYICIYIYIYIHTHTHIHIYTYTHVHIHIHTASYIKLCITYTIAHMTVQTQSINFPSRLY